MSVGSKQLAVNELDTFEDERLVDELKKSKEELFNLRFQSATVHAPDQHIVGVGVEIGLVELR